ncbi:MAG: hypothetical protein EXR58_07695 [Chloroflexi bacterium]|nr:hypothetical protein [Chloroflexota bacterium]
MSPESLLGLLTVGILIWRLPGWCFRAARWIRRRRFEQRGRLVASQSSAWGPGYFGKPAAATNPHPGRVLQAKLDEIGSLHPSIESTREGTRLQLGAQSFESTDTLDFGQEIGAVPVAGLIAGFADYLDAGKGGCRPQLAAVVAEATRKYRALDLYAPPLRAADSEAPRRFWTLATSIATNPNADIRLIDPARPELAERIAFSVTGIVAAQLAEIFFGHPDLLAAFLHRPRHIWIYANDSAFAHEGGVMGGDYNPEVEAVQLVMSRLFEGYSETVPGTCPLLHELGHLLDAVNIADGRIGRAEGTLPGLAPGDGRYFQPAARQLFLDGKRREHERYLAAVEGRNGDDPPLGHPYVFHNDGEFIAGYFEMFFRNPHAFADTCPELYASFQAALNVDPRSYVRSDFDGYVSANRAFYASGQPVPRPGISVPTD